MRRRIFSVGFVGFLAIAACGTKNQGGPTQTGGNTSSGGQRSGGSGEGTGGTGGSGGVPSSGGTSAGGGGAATGPLNTAAGAGRAGAREGLQPAPEQGAGTRRNAATAVTDAAMCLARRTIDQRAQIMLGTGNGDLLEYVAAGIHQRHDCAGQGLAERDRGAH